MPNKKQQDKPISHRADLMKAFEQVIIPELECNVVQLNCVRDMKWKDGVLTLHVVLPTFALASEKQVMAQLHKAALAVLPSGVQVEMNAYAQVEPAVGQSLVRPGYADVKNIILIGSGKGGVGKSTVTANVAAALAKLGCRVGLLDADVYGPSIPTLFGLSKDQHVSAMQGEDGKTSWMIPPQRHDIKLMSMGFLVDTPQAVVWRGPMIASACMQMFYNVAWGQLDYLFVDLPPGTGDIQLTIAQKVMVAAAVLVATPQQLALADVTRAKAMLDRLHVPILGLVENMSCFVCDQCDKRHEIFPTGGAKQAAQDLDVPFLGDIPLQKSVREGSDNGQLEVLQQPLSASAQQLTQLARDIAVRLAKTAWKRNSRATQTTSKQTTANPN
ncbi:MAG: Mrp/NBP35 family ATP-binding protein [Myxococcota bacterium]